MSWNLNAVALIFSTTLQKFRSIMRFSNTLSGVRSFIHQAYSSRKRARESGRKVERKWRVRALQRKVAEPKATPKDLTGISLESNLSERKAGGEVGHDVPDTSSHKIDNAMVAGALRATRRWEMFRKDQAKVESAPSRQSGHKEQRLLQKRSIGIFRSNNDSFPTDVKQNMSTSQAQRSVAV